MSVAYIGLSQAKPEEVDRLRDFLNSVVKSGVLSSAGCQSYQLFQSQDDPTQFIGIEMWDSIEDHRASVKNIAPESIAEFMKLVASPPRGSYYHLIS